MEAIKNFINKLGTPASDRVGIYISSDSKMEVIFYNIDTKEIYKCEKIDFQYNQVLREVLLEEFEDSIQSIFNKMDIPDNCPVCICLPHIFTAVKSLPSDLEDLEIELALASESEKSYIFKKAEPKPSWALLSENTETLANNYLYSVIQKPQVEQITKLSEQIGLKLVSVDVSFTALLRGLEYAGILQDNFDNHLKWCIITISANNYLIAKFEGKKLLNVIENPIALRSIEPDVLYPTLNSAIYEKLQHENFGNLYIVSQTRDFVAAKLADCIQLMCKIHTIDNNKLNDHPLFISSRPSAETISPESVGAACWKSSELNLNLNFMDLEGKEELDGFLGKIGVKKPIHLYLLTGAIACALLIGFTSLALTGINNYLKNQITQKSGKIKKLEKLNVTPTKEFDEKDTFLNSYKNTTGLLTSYDAIGAVIPEKLWVDSFYMDGNLNISLKGKAFNVEDIIIYYENLQKISGFKNLKIKNIDIIAVEVSDNNFSDLSFNPISISQAASGNPPVNRNSTSRYGYSQNSYNNNYPNPQQSDLPFPPAPASKTANVTKKQNYYRYTIENYKTKPHKDIDKNPLLKTLPDFVKNILFGE